MTPADFRKDKKNPNAKIYLMGDLSVKAEIPTAIPINAKKKSTPQ
jgi:hypothetical protein